MPKQKTKPNYDPEQIMAATGLSKASVEDIADLENLWKALVLFQGYPFYTAKGLKFTYNIKGHEMFVDRKEKSITKATVELAFMKAVELGGIVSGPKKLGCFGASYLYPVFIRLGVIKCQ